MSQQEAAAKAALCLWLPQQEQALLLRVPA